MVLSTFPDTYIKQEANIIISTDLFEDTLSNITIDYSNLTYEPEFKNSLEIGMKLAEPAVNTSN